jgi:hypothetical protein
VAALLPDNLVGCEAYFDLAKKLVKAEHYTVKLVRQLEMSQHKQQRWMINANDQLVAPTLPAAFHTILNSSGVGKTQLAATASIAKADTTRVVYLRVQDCADNAQVFYEPHGPTGELLHHILSHYPHTGARTMHQQGRWNSISHLFGILLGLLGGELLADCKISWDTFVRLFIKIPYEHWLVFIDEVPPAEEEGFLSAMKLRDILRSLGIAPILMSTHSGAHSAVRKRFADSRGGDPYRWVHISCQLGPALWTDETPKQGTALDLVAQSLDRPLVKQLAIEGIKQVNPEASELAKLQGAIRYIGMRLYETKKEVWTRSPIAQVAQLVYAPNVEEMKGASGSISEETKAESMSEETKAESMSEDMKSGRGKKRKSPPIDDPTHLLVGHHFGAVLQGDGDWLTLQSNEASIWKGRVSMPSPHQQPLLLLALTAWKVPGGALFPLLDTAAKPITLVQAADRHCWSFLRSALFCGNVKAAKRDGALLEALAISGGVSLASFADGLEGSTVPRFLAHLVLVLGKLGGITSSDFDATDVLAVNIENALPRRFATAKIPIVPPANSGSFPDALRKIGANCGESDRPADAARRDGTIFCTLDTPDYSQDDDGGNANDDKVEGSDGDEVEGNDDDGDDEVGRNDEDGNDEVEGDDEELVEGEESKMQIAATMESKNVAKLTAPIMSQINERIPEGVDLHITFTTELAPQGFHQTPRKWAEECRKCQHEALESARREDVLVVAARWSDAAEPELVWVKCGGRALKSRKAKLVIFILCVPLRTNDAPSTKKPKSS